MDGQGGTGQNPEGTVGQRQDPFGVQVAVVQLVDERNQMVFAKYGSGFHYPLSEVKGDILIPFPCTYKSEAKLGGKNGSKCPTDTAPQGGKIRPRNQQATAFPVSTWIKSNY